MGVMRTCIAFCWTRQLLLALWCLKDGVMFTGIIFCWTRQLFNTTSIGPVAFEGRELCALVLHSSGPDIYLALF
jgi:hypothetical protein